MSAIGTEALPHTNIASICWGNVHLRNYWQATDGTIRETQWDGSWTGGASRNVITAAKLTTPLAAIQWGDASQIRVYYLDNDNIIQEYCYSSGWTLGSLGQSKIKADPNSKLAAIVWGGPNIRLYYQKPNDPAIQELCWGPSGWSAGSTLPAACNGSSLAAIYWDNHIRVYYQTLDLQLREHCWDGKWAVGGFNYTAPFGTPLAAITWTNQPQIRVYWANNSNQLVEGAWSGKWNNPTVLTDIIPNSSLSAICWDNIKIRVYFQSVGYIVQEWAWGNGWAKGATIPTK
ncbi:hypothetical protein Q9L58_009126 [Maublancomyces gigas]|uniref:Fucose-specific lectin n=1 Tax=Discina gigas TaxID=1032678 RepID=A0ABR3G7U0_9PEZI